MSLYFNSTHCDFNQTGFAPLLRLKRLHKPFRSFQIVSDRQIVNIDCLEFRINCHQIQEVTLFYLTKIIIVNIKLAFCFKEKNCDKKISLGRDS